MTTSLRARPAATEYAPFYAGYIAGVPDGDPVALLRDGGAELDAVLRGIPESRGGFRYAEGKWSIREMLGHVIDAERIFTYRALRIARGDVTPLPGFEENDYVRAAGSDSRTIADLADELRTVRDGSVRLFTSLPEEAWSRRGNASGKDVTVRALAWITVGHATHHLRMLRERYGIATDSRTV
jgi:hypothetical protein